MKERLLRLYCTIDYRALALFRVLLSLLLLFDLARRIPDIDPFYISDGLTPNHTLLWKPVTQRSFSPFFALSHPDEVLAGFFLCALCYCSLLIGFRTRLVMLLSTVCCVGLRTRVTFLGNGGDEVLNLLCVWGLFLPLGQRFSLDALIRSRSPEWRAEAPSQKGHRSILCLAALLHISGLYFLNYYQKVGDLWSQGLSVYYCLFQNHISTPFAVWLRFRMPIELSQLLTWGTLVIEGAAPFLLLSPIKNDLTRRLGILALASLHIGIALIMDLGIFSAAMIVYLLLFLPPRDLDRLGVVLSAFVPEARRLRVEGSLVKILERLKIIPARGPVLPRVWRAGLREVLALIVISAIASEVLLVNPAIPRWMRPPRVTLFERIIDYFRIGQLWVVFPYPPTADETIVVDAITVSGRHVDPLQYAATGWSGPPWEALPPRLGLDSLWTSYFMRIDDRGMEPYRGPLHYWILAFHERTGNPADRVVSFRVFTLIQDAPPPGVRELPPVRKVEFMKFPQ